MPQNITTTTYLAHWFVAKLVFLFNLIVLSLEFMWGIHVTPFLGYIICLHGTRENKKRCSQVEIHKLEKIYDMRNSLFH